MKNDQKSAYQPSSDCQSGGWSSVGHRTGCTAAPRRYKTGPALLCSIGLNMPIYKQIRGKKGACLHSGAKEVRIAPQASLY